MNGEGQTMFGMGGFGARERARLERIESKLDAILAQLGVEWEGLPLAAGLSDEVKELVSVQRQKIAAIKLHREQTGASLYDAKQAIDAYEAEHAGRW